MCIVTTTPVAQPSSGGAAWMGILAPTGLRPWPGERQFMPLLRSLADWAARVAINMALLMELFAALPLISLPPPRS
jgi:hypothetical protein